LYWTNQLLVTGHSLGSFKLLFKIALLSSLATGERMDTHQILSDLPAELNRLNRAIAALEVLDGKSARIRTTVVNHTLW
jgi:hypothetical protein